MPDSLRITILTGAGISAESGVPTFRGPDGLWEGHRVEEVATPEAFMRNPDLVYRFYNLRRAALPKVEPNAAHRALARLEREHHSKVTLITQNVDDLHDRAGSTPIHMHGELLKARCIACGAVHDWPGDLDASHTCPACNTTGHLRPHIVWFGEVPFHMETILAAASTCDIFAAIGTSGLVHPAAGLAALAAEHGAHCVEFNLAGTGTSHAFHEQRTGPAGETVPKWVEEVVGGSKVVKMGQRSMGQGGVSPRT